MTSTHDVRTAPRPRTSGRHRVLAVTGVVATIAATAVTTAAAALARAAGVDFEVPDGGATIPTSGFAVMTAFWCAVGVIIAAGFLRWSASPARRFVRTAVALTVASLAPPLVVGAGTGTVAALVGLHLVPAVVMIPVLGRALRP